MSKVTVIALVLWTNALLGQNVILHEIGGDCYTNMENYMKFYVNGVNVNELVFTTDSGKVSQYRDRLVFKTNKAGMALFKVYKKRKGKLVLYDSVKVMVYENRYVEVRVGTKTGGYIENKCSLQSVL